MKKLFRKGFLTSIAAVMMAVVIAFGVLALASPTIIYATNDIIVTIDGVPVDFEGQPPIIVDGRTLVPVRGVFEALDFEVDFDFSSDTRQVFLTRDIDAIVIIIGSAVFTNNGVSYTLDVPAQIIGGRTLLPLRAVLESVGYYLDWDGATRTVVIETVTSTPDTAPPTAEAPQVSEAHRNAWRPTNSAFIEMALALEVLANTTVSGDTLGGVLYTFYQSDIGLVPVTSGGPGAVRDVIAGAMLTTPALYTWANTNRSAIGNLAPLAFSDVTGTEPFARDLVLLAYYNVIGNRHGTGRMQFNPNGNITRNEVVEMFFRVGQINAVNPSSPFYGLVRPVYEGNVPDWTLQAWMASGFMYANPQIPAAQVTSIADGNLTRQETAILIADWLRIDATLSIVDDSPTAMRAAGFPSTVTARFSDLNNIGPYDEESHARTRPGEVMGTAPMTPRDAWNILVLVDIGVIDGTVGNSFRPLDPVTRGEFIQMLMRALEIHARDRAVLY